MERGNLIWDTPNIGALADAQVTHGKTTERGRTRGIQFVEHGLDVGGAIAKTNRFHRAFAGTPNDVEYIGKQRGVGGLGGQKRGRLIVGPHQDSAIFE